MLQGDVVRGDLEAQGWSQIIRASDINASSPSSEQGNAVGFEVSAQRLDKGKGKQRAMEVPVPATEPTYPLYPDVDATAQSVHVNRMFYPAYDEFGNRLGMEYRHSNAPIARGNYYLNRTYHYSTAAPNPNAVQTILRLTSQAEAEANVYAEANQPVRLPVAIDPAGLVSDDSNSVESTAFEVTASTLGASHGPVPNRAWVYLQAPPTKHDPFVLGPPPETQISEEAFARRLRIAPGTPLRLSSLRDPPPGEKPEYDLPTLMKLAIWESHRKMLTLSELYKAIQNRFEWFKNPKQSTAWKASGLSPFRPAVI